MINLKKSLKVFEINVIFKYSNTIKNILIKNSPDNIIGSIYKINCNNNNCNAFYIGQTGRELKIRIKEHAKAVKNHDQNNSLFNHYLDTGHSFDFDNYSIVKNIRSFNKRNLLESYLILKTNKNNINLQPGLYSIDKILYSYLEKEFKYINV